MIIALYYILLSGFFILFGWLFQLDFNSFDSVWTYVLIIVDLLLSIVVSFSLLLLLLSVSGHIRSEKPYNNKFNHWFAKSILRYALYMMRVKVVVTGKENIPETTNFVFVGNHQENYDIMVLMPIFKKHPICFIAKEPLFTARIIGKWIGLLGNVPIGKTADREAAKSIITGIKRYKEGVAFGIFPEGMRSKSNEMIEFKPGAFKLAMKPQADLLIGTLYDMGKIFKKYPFRKSTVYVHFHPLMKYDEYKDMNTQELSVVVKEIIQKKLDEFKSTV